MISVYRSIYRKNNETTNKSFLQLIRLYSGLKIKCKVAKKNEIEHALLLRMIRGRDIGFYEIYRLISTLASWNRCVNDEKKYKWTDQLIDDLQSNNFPLNITDSSFNDRRTLLIKAVMRRDYDVVEIFVRMAIRGNILFDQVDSLGNDALMSAVYTGNLHVQRKIVKILIDAYSQSNTPLNRQNHLGNTALIIAASGGYGYYSPDIVSMLVEAHIKTNQSIETQNNMGDNALMKAAICQGYKIFGTILKAFVTCNCSLDTINNKHKTALIIAVKNKKIMKAIKLIRAGCSIECLKNIHSYYAAFKPNSEKKRIEQEESYKRINYEKLYNKLIKLDPKDISLYDFIPDPIIRTTNYSNK